MDRLQGMMRAIKLPEKTQEEIENYLTHIQMIPNLHADLTRFLNLLSPSLRQQILYHLYKDILMQIEIF